MITLLAGLEGVNPADVVPLMELRQSAEGDVVTSPVPGDGGGGGDGSSGHSRWADTALMAQCRTAVTPVHTTVLH